MGFGGSWDTGEKLRRAPKKYTCSDLAYTPTFSDTFSGHSKPFSFSFCGSSWFLSSRY